MTDLLADFIYLLFFNLLVLFFLFKKSFALEFCRNDAILYFSSEINSKTYCFLAFICHAMDNFIACIALLLFR